MGWGVNFLMLANPPSPPPPPQMHIRGLTLLASQLPDQDVFNLREDMGSKAASFLAKMWIENDLCHFPLYI